MCSLPPPPICHTPSLSLQYPCFQDLILIHVLVLLFLYISPWIMTSHLLTESPTGNEFLTAKLCNAFVAQLTFLERRNHPYSLCKLDLSHSCCNNLHLISQPYKGITFSMEGNYSLSMRRQQKRKKQTRIFLKCLGLPLPSCSLGWKPYMLPSQTCDTSKTLYCLIKFYNLWIKAHPLVINEKTTQEHLEIRRTPSLPSNILPEEDEDAKEAEEEDSREVLKSGSHARKSLFPFLY